MHSINQKKSLDRKIQAYINYHKICYFHFNSLGLSSPHSTTHFTFEYLKLCFNIISML